MNENKDKTICEKDQKSGNKKTRTRKSNRKRVRNNADSNAALDSRNRHNDPNWYFLSAEVADQASTFAFDNYIGVDTKMSVETIPSTGATTVADATVYVPSIIAMELNPSPGATDSSTMGINMAGLKTYTMLSSRNAKTTLYAPQDVSTLILAMGEIVSILEHIRRAFGVAFTYNQRNRALPSKLLQVMGFDPEEFFANQADFRLQFNSWITAINKIPFPVNIAYIAKCADIYRHVYLDSESSMAQVLFNRPYSTWVLKEAASDQGSVLQTTSLPIYNTKTSVDASWKDWAATVDTMINALLSSSTFNYIFSDVLMLHDKYSMPLMQMEYLSADYMVLPEYNRNYMLQVHNATPIGRPVDTSVSGYTINNDVNHNPDYNSLKYKPLFRIAENAIIQQPIVDMDVPDPSLEDRIEATRYTATFTVIINAGKKYYDCELPDHYVVDFRVVLGNGEASASASYGYESRIFNFTNPCVDIDTLQNVYSLSQVDWAPLVYFVRGTAPNQYVTMIGDLNYWTTIRKEWFGRVNDLAFQALFEVR